MTPTETLLLSAIGGLCAVVVALWRQLSHERTEAIHEKRTDARLIFALLSRLSFARSERPPPTVSTPERPNIVEARALAVQAINGELETLLTDYLDGPPTKPGKGKRP